VSLRLLHAAEDWNSCCVCQGGSTQIYVQICGGDQTIDVVRSKRIRDLDQFCHRYGRLRSNHRKDGCARRIRDDQGTAQIIFQELQVAPVNQIRFSG
jgi:hypothetical protein